MSLRLCSSRALPSTQNWRFWFCCYDRLNYNLLVVELLCRNQKLCISIFLLAVFWPKHVKLTITCNFFLHLPSSHLSFIFMSQNVEKFICTLSCSVWKYFKNFLVIFFYSNVYEKACKNMREVLGKYVERFLVKLTQTGLNFP